jgi:hypothetical protein
MVRSGSRQPGRARNARARFAAVSLALALLLSSLPVAAAAPEGIESSVVVSDLHQLSAAQVQAANITGTERADRLIAGHIEDTGEPAKQASRFAVYDFGAGTLIVDEATPFRVITGENEYGQDIQDVIVSTGTSGFTASSAYIVPPKEAFAWYMDNTFTYIIECWKRTVWWTITKANNYTGGGGTWDYYRLYGKMQASTLTSCGADDGYRRAWIEFDRNAGWSPVTEFETPKPEQSYGGGGTQTLTIGFSSNWNVNLGVPPLTVGGGSQTSYGGSLNNQNLENWHPVQRDEAGSGGVQWCRYTANEYTGTRVVTTRVPARIGSSGIMNGWDILTGQQGKADNCPTQE